MGKNENPSGSIWWRRLLDKFKVVTELKDAKGLLLNVCIWVKDRSTALSIKDVCLRYSPSLCSVVRGLWDKSKVCRLTSRSSVLVLNVSSLLCVSSRYWRFALLISGMSLRRQ
jgi:hypothetical protein